MDFFGIGIGEVIVILILAIMILGPRKVPEIARTIGKMGRAFRKVTYDFTNEVTREVDLEGEEKKSSSQIQKANGTKPEDS